MHCILLFVSSRRRHTRYWRDWSSDVCSSDLYRTGFANQPTSISPDDGLAVADLYVAAVVRCAPPDNKPFPDERDRCLPYLAREMALLHELRVIVALGAFAWDGALRALRELGFRAPSRPRFGHLEEARVGPYAIVGSYHPSQQNTFTGRLTPEMLDEVMLRARELASLEPPEGAGIG